MHPRTGLVRGGPSRGPEGSRADSRHQDFGGCSRARLAVPQRPIAPRDGEVPYSGIQSQLLDEAFKHYRLGREERLHGGEGGLGLLPRRRRRRSNHLSGCNGN